MECRRRIERDTVIEAKSQADEPSGPAGLNPPRKQAEDMTAPETFAKLQSTLDKGRRPDITPISRPRVKGARNFFGGVSRQLNPSFRSISGRFRTTPVSSRLAANACAIAPDTHEDQAWSGLAAFPRPGGSAAPEERWFRAESKRFSVSMAVGFSTPISGWVTARAIRFLLPLATAIRRPIQFSWLQPQSPYMARRIAVFPSGEAARHIERPALLQDGGAGPRERGRHRLW